MKSKTKIWLGVGAFAVVGAAGTSGIAGPVATGARFVYASSAATYGDGAQGMDDKIDELTKLRPLNMYGYSKHLFDLYAQRAGISRRIVGLKYFNVYGPNENHKGDMRSVVNKAFDQIRATGKVQLFKSHRPDYRDGEQQRDRRKTAERGDRRGACARGDAVAPAGGAGRPVRGWSGAAHGDIRHDALNPPHAGTGRAA